MSAKLFAVDSVETFSEFEHKALAIADSIRERGAREGVRVLLKAGNSASYVATLFALMHVGSSIVLVGHEEKAAVTRQICVQSGAELVLIDDDVPIADDTEVVFLHDLLVDSVERPRSDLALDFGPWCALPDGLIMWSSGSTGQAKGVVKNGGRFLTNLERNARHMGHRSDDVLLPLLPFSHQYGLSMVLIAWIARCSLVIAPYRRLDRALSMAGRCGATVLDATPAGYRSLLKIVRGRPSALAHLRRVRMFCSGSAPLDPTLNDRYLTEFGMPLLDSYGSTELGNIAFATVDNPMGCGRVMDGLRMKIVDEYGRTQGPGEVGEVLVDSPDMMEGYLGADGTLSPALRGWYPTNDLGYLDSEDNLFVVGRKLAVHRNGYTLYPEVIERKAAVAGCSTKIVALADERRGCQLVFFVEDAQGRDIQHVRELINCALPVYEQPNRIHLLDHFPLNVNGKPDKAALERLAVAGPVT